MGKIIAHTYRIGALTTGMYGTIQNWHAGLNNGINQMTNGKLEEMVKAAPAIVQPAIELLPYALIVYAAMELGGRMLGNRQVSIQRK